MMGSQTVKGMCTDIACKCGNGRLEVEAVINRDSGNINGLRSC